MPVTREALLDQYQKALDEDVAAAFVGAGLSVPAGFVDWKELLREIARDLDLNVDEETDLITLAQYHFNHTRTRSLLNQKLIDEFTKDAQPTGNHHLLANLPFTSIWTTNYDHLIEDAFRDAHKRVDKKVVEKHLRLTVPKRDVVLYKMHGDVDDPDDAVLMKADYECYDQKRSLFSEQLKGDLLSKTFLFLGLSFTDPNINYILGRVRSLSGLSPRTHYWITRDANKNPNAGPLDKKHQKHRIDDLKTYGVRTLLVEDYAEITKILRELGRRVNRRNVFFSGSAHEYGALGQARVLPLLRKLGTALIDQGFNLVSGMGLGVGDAVAMGAIEAVYRKPAEHLEQRTILRPFPQPPVDGADRPKFKRSYREDMLGRARSAIFVLGNKVVAGNVLLADGMREEFEIALKAGVYPIPIGATGYVAEQLSAEVRAKVDDLYGPLAGEVKPHLEVLADAKADDDKLVNAVMAILKAIAPK